MSELLIGCGNDRRKKVTFPGIPTDWTKMVAMDFDPSVKPDVVHDLNVFPYPFPEHEFNEIHAYEVLEHCGKQGDFQFFFAQFAEFYRILKPDGYFIATVRMWDSPWAWGDPGHTRVITRGSLVFLDPEEYKQLGKTAMSDCRPWLNCNFKVIALKEEQEMFGFVLQAKK